MAVLHSVAKRGPTFDVSKRYRAALIYLMRGPSREEWEHSIPAVEELRYSVTFRALRKIKP
jgi:alkylated DNA repair dioxygenase AlkB